MPDLTALPANLRTLIITNQQRLGDRFGATPAANAMTALGELAAASGVHGAVLPIEGSATVQATYAQLNANPCHIDNTNAVVSSIVGLVDRIRRGDAGAGIAPHPQLDSIVIAGGDDIVPMARLVDGTRVGNEKTYADRFAPNTPLWAAFITEHIVSDNPYGDVDPISFGGDARAYVPDLALGRLVESPADIQRSVQTYLDAGGVLDPSKTYQTGYDFMDDGAALAQSNLSGALRTASGGTAPTTPNRIGPTWNGAAVAGDLAAQAPGYVGLFGHFDETLMLSQAGHAAGSGDSLDATTAANSVPVGARLVFSMGCHSGLSVPDAEQPGIGTDFAQALSSRGAALVGSTGFGYGDAVTPGAGEKLLADFTRGLDGHATIGQALIDAKQRYYADSGLYGPYDDKVLGETTFYGIPFYRPGPVATNPNPAETATTPVPGSSLDSADLSVDPSFSRVDTARGSYFVANRPTGGSFDPQSTANRPVQPRLDADITAVDAANLRPAHGALVTGLTTGAEVSPFDPVFARPGIGTAADEPEQSWGDVAFPDRLVGVTTFSDPAGFPFGTGLRQRQNLVVVPGQYRGSSAYTRQRLYTHLGVRVFYSASNDYRAPTIDLATATEGQPTTTFSMNASDGSGIHRVLVLWRDLDTDWTPLELTESAGTWSGSIPQSDNGVEWSAQVVDGAGNVNVFSNKGRMTAASEPPAPGSSAPLAVPAPVVKLGPAAGQATVAWTPPFYDGNSAITGYRVLRGTTSGALSEIGTTDGVTTTFVDPNASAGTAQYFYAVVAQNANGDAPASAETAYAPVTVTISDATVLEPDVATPGVTGRVRITLSQPAPTDTKVTYYTVDGAATGVSTLTGGDYKIKGTSVKPITATILAGKVFATATVLVRPDAELESGEALQVHLGGVTLGTAVIGDADGQVTILDSDSIAGANPVLVVTDARIVEGGFGGPRTVQLLAQLDRPLGADLQLQWQTADGSAVQPGDYILKKPVMPFIRAGKLFVVLTVTLKPDVLGEGDETISVPVSVLAGGPVTVVDGTGTITIVNDD